MFRAFLAGAALILTLAVFSPFTTTAEGSVFVAQSGDAQSLSDEEVRKALIRQSIASYSGNCACPYNLASNGSRCGKRSAYSRPGGASPLCYASDVTDEMVERFRRRGN